MANELNTQPIVSLLTAVVLIASIIGGGYTITAKLVRIELQLELNTELIKKTGEDLWTRSDMRHYSHSLEQLNPDLRMPVE